MTLPENMTAEAMRMAHGWFGDPWPSGICYDDDGRLTEEMRKPFPAGEQCLYCSETLDEAAGDSGKAMPFFGAAGGGSVRHVHKECMFREVAGPLAHLERRCPCFGGDSNQTPGLTLRQEALEVWRRVAGRAAP